MKMTETGIAVNGLMMIFLIIGVVITLVTGQWAHGLELCALLVILINTSVAIY